jgi:hypothetical protein
VLNTTSVSRVVRVCSSLLLGTAVLAGTGCSHFRHGEEDVPLEPAVVEFENQSLDQADVFVVRLGADSRRIGTVQAGRTEVLQVPRDMLIGGTVDIVARLLAHSFTPSSGQVSLNPGERLHITLPPNARQLTVLPAAP